MSLSSLCLSHSGVTFETWGPVSGRVFGFRYGGRSDSVLVGLRTI